jgi:pimeloyl-ACP methyl ester carboxylesterase
MLKSILRRALATVAIAVSIAVSTVAAAQNAPDIVRLSTGSEIATWSIAPDRPIHKTPIIFLHGGPGMYTEARRFDEGAPFRAAGFTTIYFDQAGGGRSKRLVASAYSLDRAVADLEALRVALGQERLLLWGNSYGASLATVYAARYRGKVAGLVLTSPGTFPGTNPKRSYGLTNRDKVKLGTALSSAVNKIDSKGAAAEAELSQSDAGALLDIATSAELIEAMVCKGAQVTPPQLAGGANLYANRIILKSVEKMAFKPGAPMPLPTLILRGACDFLPETNAVIYAKLFATSVTTLPATGHGLLENRSAIDAAFRAFADGPLKGIE